MYSTHSRLLTAAGFRLRPVRLLIFEATILIATQIHAGAQAVARPFGQDDRQHVSLPTPRAHYETFTRATTGLPLLVVLLKEAEPEVRQLFLQFAIAAGLQDANAESGGRRNQLPFTREQAVATLKKTRWAEQRPLISELIVHQSNVLELIPEKWGAIWAPIVHDAMLSFLDHLSDDRLLDKLVGLAMLPANTSRAEFLAEFVAKMPCLQKVGQILARNPDLAPDHQRALQNLESGIRTMSGPELSQFIISDIGKERIDQYQMQFSDTVLAEASVGAVMLAVGIPPGTTERRQMVCKVVKPYVLLYMPEDLAIIDTLAEYFTTYHDFYNLGSMPLVEIFRGIRKALTNEINVVAEQKNFIRAREYYKGSRKVIIPQIYPISNEHVTVMEFIKGEKITSAFPGDAGKRSILARQLSDTMTGDVIFSKQPEAIFHGDPHPGNVFHLMGDPEHPYTIALLDWGLMGTFPKEDRKALVQLIVGVRLRDAKRLHENAGFLVEGGIPNDPGRWQKVDALIADIVKPEPAISAFEGLESLVGGLIEQGYTTKFDLNTFIKSQLTIAGELIDLDPKLKQDDLLEKRVTSMVKKELFKRIPCFVFCPNSRNYGSMLSNNDVKALRKHARNNAKQKGAERRAAQPAMVANVQ